MDEEIGEGLFDTTFEVFFILVGNFLKVTISFGNINKQLFKDRVLGRFHKLTHWLAGNRSKMFCHYFLDFKILDYKLG